MQLPDGWRIVELGESVEITTGFPFKSENYTEEDDDIRLLRGDNITPGNLRWTDAKRWKYSEIGSYAKYALCVDDIVIAMDRPWIGAGLKWAKLRSEDLPSLLVQRVARLRALEGISQNFIAQIIGSDSFMEYLKSLQVGSAVPHVSGQDIKEYNFPLPPLAEQRAIAAILGTWDEAIDLTRRLIAALKQRKQALMQLLLTGEVRFPGFDGEWEEVLLGEILEPVSRIENVEATREYNLVGVKLNVAGVHIHETRLGETIITKSLSRVKADDIMYNKMWVTKAAFGIAGMEHEGGYVSNEYPQFRVITSKIKTDVIRYIFHSKVFQHRAAELCKGSTGRARLDPSDFLKLEVKIPSLAEQEKISEFLEANEAYLVRSERYLLALQTQKRGLMQKLLTGQVRVNVEGE